MRHALQSEACLAVVTGLCNPRPAVELLQAQQQLQASLATPWLQWRRFESWRRGCRPSLRRSGHCSAALPIQAPLASHRYTAAQLSGRRRRGTPAAWTCKRAAFESCGGSVASYLAMYRAIGHNTRGSRGCCRRLRKLTSRLDFDHSSPALPHLILRIVTELALVPACMVPAPRLGLAAMLPAFAQSYPPSLSRARGGRPLQTARRDCLRRRPATSVAVDRALAQRLLILSVATPALTPQRLLAQDSLPILSLLRSLTRV